MFGSKSRGQVISEELSEGMSHVRTAASEATKAATDALSPRVEAARDAVTPRVEAAKDALESRLVAARDQGEARRANLADLADQSHRNAKKTAKRAKKNAHKAKKVAAGARKDAKAALADAKAQARVAVGKEPKKRRRMPYVLLVAVGIIGALVARSRRKTDDDLWGARSDSPVRGYTEDPQPSTVAAMGDDRKADTPATDDPYPGRDADNDGTIAEKTDDYKAVAPDNDGPLHGKLADSAHETGTAVGDTRAAQDETWSEMIDATKDNDDGPNATEAAKHAAKEPTKKSTGP